MKRLHLLRGLSVAALVAVCMAGTAYAQGKLEIVGGDTYDWGTVAPGKLNTVIEVKNAGNGELKINEVRPSCGCTAAPIDKNLLQPGEIGKISITLDVSTRSGPVEKTVSITSSDAANAVQVLRLRANVYKPLNVTPAQYMVISDGKVGVESAATPVRISNASKETITIYPPELSQGNVKIRFDMNGKKELKPGEEYELKAYVTPQEESHVYGQLKMKSSSTEMPSLDFNISGTMVKADAPQQSQSATQGHTHK